MSQDVEPVKMLIVGRSKMGKTVFAHRFVRNAPHSFKFVMDHDAKKQFRTNNPGAARWLCVDERGLKKAVEQRWPMIVFDPHTMFPGRLNAASEFWCEFCFETSKIFPGLKLVFMDEVQLLAGPNKKPPEFCKVFETGRHFGLDFVGCTLAFNAIHNALRGQVTDLVSFQTTEPLALDAMLKVGLPVERVRGLQRGDFVHYDMNAQEAWKGRLTL